MVNSSTMDYEIFSTNSSDNLISRMSATTLDIRGINYQLTRRYQRLAMAYDRIYGGDTIESNKVIRQSKNIKTGEKIEYPQGRILFKNGIDKIQFLLDHRSELAETLGFDTKEIYDRRRDIGFVNQVMAKLESVYELGDSSKIPQMYISLHDSNTENLDSISDWSQYLMTHDFVDEIGKTDVSDDARLEELSNTIQELMDEHRKSMHESISSFNADEFLDSENGASNDAEYEMQKLNSIGNATYGIYELFKPIGSSSRKFIKIRVDSDGTIDIQGVLGLDEDCIYIPWIHGSKEYLRSLNTKNKKYEFRLDRDINDSDSSIWWKPDEAEKYEYVETDDDGNETTTIKSRYFKSYENERMLRWFGTSTIPRIDINGIYKKTICSIPILDTDVVQGKNDFSDSDTLTNLNFTKTDIEESESDNGTNPLLTLAQKSTVEIEDRGEDGQWLVFVIGGKQKTSTISFHIQGTIKKDSESRKGLNQFTRTSRLLVGIYTTLSKNLLYLDSISKDNPRIQELWRSVGGEGKFIPTEWMTIRNGIEDIVWNPSSLDFDRMRQIDLNKIQERIDDMMGERKTFVEFAYYGEQSIQNKMRKLGILKFNYNPLYETLFLKYDELDEEERTNAFKELNADDYKKANLE